MGDHPAPSVAVSSSRSSQSEERRRITIEALLEAQRLTEPTFASDGRLAFTVSASFRRSPAAPRSQIWVATGDGEAERASGGDNDALPRWSPDDAQLAFMSSRPPARERHLHVLTLESGGLREYPDVNAGIAEIVWSPDGQELLVLGTDVGPPSGSADARGEVDGAGDRTTTQPDPLVVRPTKSWRRLYRVDLVTGQTRTVGPADLSVWEFDWLGGATVAAVASTSPSESGWYTSFIAAIDLRDDTALVVHRPQWQLSSPRLSPDERCIAFVEGICSDRGGVSGVLTTVEFDCDASVTSRVGRTGSPAPGLEVTGLGWRDEQSLWYAGRQGMGSMCGTVSVDGTHDQLWSGDAVLREVSASADGQRLVAVKETLIDPPEVSLFDARTPAQGWCAVTGFNASLSALDLPLVDRMLWTAPDGLDIEGMLVRPLGDGERAPAPLVVLVHGGPTAAWSAAFPCGGRHAALLAEAGFAVLLPNPRGSSGRGQEFAQAVVGDLGGAELQDTLSGVDACVTAGHVDTDRVGIMGASHGGFMAAWAVTQTARFRAAVAIACVSDYLSLHYTSDIGALDDILFVGDDRVVAYVERSPIAHVHKCTTPVLIIHGERDECCPPSQARELYGGLVQQGVETQLVLYPREGHGFVEYDHQLDLWRRVEGWFGFHLAGSG